MILVGMSQNANRTVVFSQQPDSSVRHYFNGMYIECTPLLTGCGHLLESFRFRIKAMNAVVIGQQPEKTVTVFIHTVRPIIGQTDVISLTSLICFEGITVETVDTIPGGKPKVVFVILQHAHHRVLRQPILGRVMGEKAMLLCMCREHNS